MLTKYLFALVVGISSWFAGSNGVFASPVMSFENNPSEPKVSGITLTKSEVGKFPGVAICTKSGDYVIDLNSYVPPPPGSSHNSVVNGTTNGTCWG